MSISKFEIVDFVCTECGNKFPIPRPNNKRREKGHMRGYYNSLVANGKSYTTQHTYIYNILQFFDYIKSEFHLNIDEIESFAKIKSSMLNSYIISLADISNSSKATKMYAVKSFFEFLLNDDYIDSNPCDKIKIPKDNKEHEVTSLTQREINKIKKIF